MPPSPSNLWKQRGLFADLAKIGLKRKRKGPVTEVVSKPAGLERLPALKTWARDVYVSRPIAAAVSL